ncbi:MAG: hypothetical protein FWH32_04155 [Clostridiales bacterium]|nr:hypothetical protein [Clostridiales bacterium]
MTTFSPKKKEDLLNAMHKKATGAKENGTGVKGLTEKTVGVKDPTERMAGVKDLTERTASVGVRHGMARMQTANAGADAATEAI